MSLTDQIIPRPQPGYKILAPYRVEQHQEEQRVAESGPPRERVPVHDPYWNRRFWSIQHVHDCIEGKAFHWFWSPMKEVFDLSQAMFMLTPVAVYMQGRGAHVGIRGLVIMVLSLKVLITACKFILEWFHNYRFRHIKYRVVRMVA